MFVRESEAKEILAQYGLAVPRGRRASTPEAAEAAARDLGARRYAVKALIHAGGRGLAGGVKLAATPSAVREIAASLLGSQLVTEQTRSEGELVEEVYVEEAIDFDTSFYLSVLIDPEAAVPILLASSAGGVDFEQKAGEAPSMVRKFAFGPDGGFNPAQLSSFLESFGLEKTARASLQEAVGALLEAFRQTDSNLIEINPLAVLADGSAVAADAKMVLDANAMFRHPEFETLSSRLDADPTEMIAQQNEINFVKMDGNIGLVVNGAGLGLATYDMVIEAGGRPANFMDIRTTATSFQIAKGIGLLLDTPEVEVLLVNIHGGGMTSCDSISEALSFAYARATRRLPIVLRLAGQNAEWATRMVADRKLPHELASNMSDAVRRAVERAERGGRA